MSDACRRDVGGREAWYQPQDAWTTLGGILTVRGGSLTVERLVLGK